ncbi:hypothetical protein FE257_003081 [Aspergillus nanangensis]|uniref:Glutathione synthetase n=1 Tax=Aspergillus nanangensis TaxID=2582783 RepID=A0AAD4GNN6_ASPNN|nr:hypothetical protein FE257_003081 [Aspergillus nanangensis]
MAGKTPAIPSPSFFPHDYPPISSEDQGLWIASQIQDWQINHGSLLKDIQSQAAHTVRTYPVGVSVYPTPFPRALFERALELQSIYNELYCAMAEDEQWIFKTIKDLLPIHPLAESLWSIHVKVKDTGGYVQDISAGIFRSDYMLSVGPRTELKQVEINTFSCAGASHANKTVDMHRNLTRMGVYEAGGENSISISSLPINNNIESLATCLAQAHAAYGPQKSKLAKQVAVLFVVQPRNFNIADERPIEYALWNRDVSVPAYRVEFAQDVLDYTSLTDSKELLFHPPWLGTRPPIEVSVIYMRAGYESHEYDDRGREARLRLEMSRAIKCPSLLSHILTFKKVQQCLTEPGALDRFLSAEKAAAVRSTFVDMYPMDGSETGNHACDMAVNRPTGRDYVLKPSLEGGGNNVYGEAISEFLENIPMAEWKAYILMKKINSPAIENVLMSPRGIELGEVISELGVLGGCLWRRVDRNGGSEMLQNMVAGWTFKTKSADVNEMSVVKGFGCFDTPLLF